MSRKKFACVVAALTLCVGLLTACGGNAGRKINASSDAVTVSSTQELLEAIAPGAEIVIAPGYYNMSEYLQELWETEGTAWNARHDYVQLLDCYDGVEFVIQNVEGLSITGGSNDMTETELVVEPRYATVFGFKNCGHVKLSSLTLGHTDTGYCVGSVVGLSGCEVIELRNMDLYGCGVFALDCEDGTGDVSVYDSALRDCSYGPLYIVGGVGKFEFYDCTLTGSESGGYYDDAGRSKLSFYRCTFGEQETNYWYMLDGNCAAMQDCTWAEIPDYVGEDYDGYEGGDFQISLDPSAMSAVSFPLDTYADSVWLGYAMENEQTNAPSGESVSNVNILLRSDGTGSLSMYYDTERPLAFLWERDEDNDANLSFWTKNNGVLQATLYSPDDADDSTFPPAWLKLQTPEGVVWMY